MQLPCVRIICPLFTALQAYTDALRGDVKAMGSSLVCLPEVDAGGWGCREHGLCWRVPVQEAENNAEARWLALYRNLRCPTTPAAQPAAACP